MKQKGDWGYDLVFDEKAILFLLKLQENIKKRIFDKIILSKKSPFYFFERLKGRTDYKLRIGAYRVIADINKEKRIIQITSIGHRKNIYKKI